MILRNVSRIINKIMVRLALMKNTSRVVLVNTKRKSTVGLIPMLFQRVFPRVPIRGSGRRARRFGVAFEKSCLFCLVRGCFFLGVGWIKDRLTSNFTSFMNESTSFRFPGSTLAIPRMISTVLPRTIFPCRAVHFENEHGLQDRRVNE